MSAPDITHPEHRKTWDLLPWLVNGRLADRDVCRVEAHLRGCGACRDELAAQQRIASVMSADSGVATMPAAGLNKLRARLDAAAASADPAVIAAHGHTTPVPAKLDDNRELRRSSRRRAVAIAASAISVSAVLGVTAAILWGRSEAPPTAVYYTVTTTTSPDVHAALRAVFAPTVTLAELQTVLDGAGLGIVSGPTAAGVYSLAQTAAHPLDWSLRQLRAHPQVRFAEIVGTAAAAPTAPTGSSASVASRAPQP